MAYKLCNDKCIIHFDLRYAYNHFDCLILIYTMILSLRQVFQGLATNGSFCLTEILKLREHQYSQDARFWGRKETEHPSVIVDNGTLRPAPNTFAVVRN
jgi:hypothetical protein